MANDDIECPYPHCDQNVLHAPGECRYCDMYPDRQRERVDQKINFTGQSDPEKAVCPAEVVRPASTIHQWGGYRPVKSTEPIPD